MKRRSWRAAIRLTGLAGWFLVLGAAKHLVPLARLARWAWTDPVPQPRDGSREELIGRVLQAGRVTGAPDRDCVQRSLLLYRELSRAGADPVLVTGVRREAGRLAGHAWVEVEGRPIAEPVDDLRRFGVLVKFGRRGAVLSDALAGAANAPARS